MMDMVDKVARAIYAERPNMYEEWVFLTTHAPQKEKVLIATAWEEATDRHEDCLNQAHAAIEALMDPTPEMSDAGNKAFRKTRLMQSPVSAIWQAMLKAALDAG